MFRFLLCLPIALAAGKSDGTCGYQCLADSECSGCGTAGACSCPDGPTAQFPNISCTCISKPANPPKSPESIGAEDASWPSQWSANVDGWVYSDFSDKAATASGKFFYDAVRGAQRGEWKPYTSGKDATQIWLVDGGKSRYYVKSGFLCLYFPITDPGIEGKPNVGIETANWMQTCKEAGMAQYTGREQVNVEGEDVWTDHWTCHVNYESVGQQITFQNWHSLGLGTVPKGLPVRVTGGNSAPNGQKGSPRLSNVWYKDFVVGPNATTADDFKKPGGLCIPVGAEEQKAFFGHKVTSAHAWNPEFHKRAHYILHRKASDKDLKRARQPKPSRAFQGSHFAETKQKLNDILLRDHGLRTQKCEDFTFQLLQEMQRELFNARTHELDSVYQGVGDTRKMAHASLDSLKQEQARHALIKTPSLAAKARDGACHEMVMWYIHHLSESAREEIKERLLLPLLPETEHEAPVAADKDADEVHRRYTAQASCAVCHTMVKDTSVVV